MTKKQGKLRSGAIIGLFMIIVGIFYIFNLSVSSTAKNQAVETIMELTVRSAEVFEVSFSEKIKSLKIATELLEGAENEAQEALLLSQYIKINNTSIGIMNSHGRGVMSSGEVISFTDEPVFSEMKSATEGITSLYYDKISGKRVALVFSEYINSKQQNCKVFTYINAEDLYDYFNMTIYQGEGFSYIIDRNGNSVIRSTSVQSNKTFSNIFDILGGSEENEARIEGIKSAVMENLSGYTYYDGDGGRMLLAFVPIPTTKGWSVVTIIPETVLLKSPRIIAAKAIALAVIILALVLGLTYALVSLNKKLKKETMELVTTDAVTGHMNFVCFKEKCEEILRNNPDGTFTIGSVDLRNFKVVNEAYGFSEGDIILKMISQELCKSHKLVLAHARLSGDVFVLLMSTQDKAVILAEHSRLNSMRRFKQYDLKFYAGFYFVNGKKDISNINALIDRADMAKKKAKADDDISCAFYEEDMYKEERLNHQMEMEMETALVQGEFQVYLQPKFSADKKQCRCAEALVRWIHPKKGIIPPGKFIPLFERNKFIGKLDQYVCEYCCQLIQKWIQQGKAPMSISVNVSKVQVYRPDFVQSYVGLKEKYEIPDGLMELEFTESMFFKDIEYLSARIRELQKKGFLCSIDDFGKGYSSFCSLKDLPFDILKIDKMFFSDNIHAERERLIIAHIVDMSKSLRMKTVAEGIETQETVDYLKKIKCDLIQGFVFSKPIPVTEFEEIYMSSAEEIVEDTVARHNSERIYFSLNPVLMREYDKALLNIYDELYELDVTDNNYRMIYHMPNKYVFTSGMGSLLEKVDEASNRFIMEDDREAFREFLNITNIRKSFRNGCKFIMGDFRRLCKDDMYRWISLTIFQTDMEEKEIYLCFVMDIDAKKLAEIDSPTGHGQPN